MKIKWAVDDSWFGKSGIRVFEIPDEDFEGMNEEEKDDYIDDRVNKKGLRTISFWWEKEE